MKLNLKTRNLVKIIILLFLSNCTINDNFISNINSENKLIGEWNLYSVKMEEVKTYYDYLSEKDVTDTVMTKHFTDKLNNWTWILNEDSSFISIQQINGEIFTNVGEWSENKESFISLNGKPLFKHNNSYIFDNELNIVFETDIKGYLLTVLLNFKRSIIL
jgi:hypothetical protein